MLWKLAQMPFYRFYMLDRSDQIVNRDNLDLASNDAAIEFGVLMLASSHYEGIEIWHGVSLVRTVKRADLTQYRKP
jgi:hypothetical protein